MSKVILVMNDPMFCCNCPLARMSFNRSGYVCAIARQTDKDCYWENVDMDSETKPDWCPLKPTPEKMDIPDFDYSIRAESDNAFDVGAYMYNRGELYGWNHCLDRILR